MIDVISALPLRQIRRVLCTMLSVFTYLLTSNTSPASVSTLNEFPAVVTPKAAIANRISNPKTTKTIVTAMIACPTEMPSRLCPDTRICVKRACRRKPSMRRRRSPTTDCQDQCPENDCSKNIQLSELFLPRLSIAFPPITRQTRWELIYPHKHLQGTVPEAIVLSWTGDRGL